MKRELEQPHIALFLPALEGGGAERVVLDLAGAFVARGLAVDLVVAHMRGALVDQVPDGVHVIDLGVARTALAVPRLSRYLRSARPVALLSTLGHANIVAMFSKWIAGTRTRVVLREAIHLSRDLPSSSLFNRLLRQLLRLTYRRAASLIAVSEGVASDLIKSGFAHADHVHAINNPSVTPRVMAAVGVVPDHRWYQDTDKVPIITSVGRLSPQKDHATLLRAFAMVRREKPCRLILLGDGPLGPALEDLAADLGVRNDIEFLGFVPDPFPFVWASQLFVLSSSYEGLPNALIQALALGVPAVSTDCPSGPAEVLDGGRFGALVPVGNADALASAITYSLNNVPVPVPREWLDQYSIVGVAEQYLSVLISD